MDKTTEKLIDDIIEFILEDMDCHHDQDHDEDGVHTTVDYRLKNETKLKEMIEKLIDQSKKELFEIKVQEYERGLSDAQSTVDEEFVEFWADKYLYEGHANYLRKQVKLMLEEAGVEVKKNEPNK